MKVYTKIVMDMGTMETVSEEYFEYDGPVALCGGSGGSGGVDKDYNSRMAGIFESQTGMAEQLFNFYRYGTFDAPGAAGGAGGTGGGAAGEFYTSESGDKNWASGMQQRYGWKEGDKGYWVDKSGNYIPKSAADTMGPETLWKYGYEWKPESAAAAAAATPAAPKGSGPNGEMTLADYAKLPASYANMELGQVAANMSLIPGQTKLAKGQIDQALELLPQQTEVGKWDLWQQKKILRNQNKIIPQLFSLAQQYNPKSAMREAGAEVSQAYANQSMQLGDSLRRTGAMPGSGQVAGLMEDLRFDRTKAIAGARTAARNQARDTQYARLSGLMSL